MDFPKEATTEDKKFLKQCYLDNLMLSRSQCYESIEDYEYSIKKLFIQISNEKHNIEQLTKEIENVENTKVD